MYKSLLIIVSTLFKNKSIRSQCFRYLARFNALIHMKYGFDIIAVGDNECEHNELYCESIKHL